MSPLGKDPLLTLWAIPKKEEVPLILNAKQTIDNKLKGPNFPIHMTLSGKIDLNKTDEKGIEEKMVTNFSPFENSVFDRDFIIGKIHYVRFMNESDMIG